MPLTRFPIFRRHPVAGSWPPLLALFLLLAAPPAALAETFPNVLIAHMFPRESFPDQAARELAAILGVDGGFGTIQVLGDARLGDERDNLRQVEQGEVDITVVGTLLFNYLLPSYRMVGAPFLFRDLEGLAALYDGPIGEEMGAAIRAQGLEILSWHCIGQRLLTANRPLTSPTHIRGLRLRLPPDATWSAVWSALGATPKSVPFPELYAALRRGEVEAQENPPSLIRSQRFYEVQSHLMLTRHLLQTQFIVAGRAFLERIGAPAAARLRRAAQGVSAGVCRNALAQEETDIAWLVREGGMTPVALNLDAAAHRLLPRVARQLDSEAGEALLTRILGGGKGH